MLLSAEDNEYSKIVAGIIYDGHIGNAKLNQIAEYIKPKYGQPTRALYNFNAIASPGFYILANNVANQITISAPNVTLDLNGHTISGGMNGIVINSGLANVTIKNGTVSGVSDGIQINEGCKDITLNQVAIKSCTRGMHLQAMNDVVIRSCDFLLNTTGLHVDNCHNVYVENCVAQANIQAGFSLIESTTCTFVDCKALSTGDNNMSTFGETSNVFGFVTSNGHGNIFERCIANSTQALTTTDGKSIVAGFGLKGTEQCSKIIGCEAGTAMTSPTGATIPYGIWLESRFDGLTTVTSAGFTANTLVEGTYAVDWSPDGNYLAAGLFLTSVTDTLVVFKFDRLARNLSILDGAIPDNEVSLILTVKWSPDGQYIAAGTTSSPATNDLFVFKFDQTTEQLTQIISVNPGGAGTDDSVRSVDWSPDGQYLAVGLSVADTTTGFTFFLYKFDRVAQTLTQVESLNPNGAGAAGSVQAVEWSPDGNYLALGGFFNGVTNLFLYSFNRSTQRLTQVDAESVDGGGADTVNAIAWTPDGHYLAVGGNFDGATSNDLVIYRFNRNQTLTKVDAINTGGGSTSDTVSALSWTADGVYLAAGGAISATTNNDLFIYKFDQSTETLTQIDAVNPGETGVANTILSVPWSPDGNYLATCGTFPGGSAAIDTIYMYTGLQFPENNVIVNNTVYCDAGATTLGGVGISGSSIANLMIGNSAFNNLFNYQFVCNVFNQLFGQGPSLTQNIAIEPDVPIITPDDIQTCIKRTNLLLESLIDNLL